MKTDTEVLAGGSTRKPFAVGGPLADFVVGLTGIAPAYGASILTDRETAEAASADCRCRRVDAVRVKGRQEKEELYEMVVACD